MGWNPANWGWVDKLQGQNNNSSPTTPTPDPNKVYGTINGRQYNYGGDFLPAQPSTAAKVDNSYINSLNSQLAALQRQIAYQPKLPQFDILANYNRARSKAESAVNPLYNKYLKDFLAGQKVKETTKRGQIGLEKESTALELSQTLAGSQVNRQRTAEDTAADIEKLNVSEGNFQQDSGTQFDQDRRALAEEVASRGLTNTGVGGGQIFDQQNLRNLDEGRQVQEYANQKAAKRLFESRTFDDLARGDADSKAIAKQKDKSSNFDLERYLQELSVDETQFRNENEYKRLTDIMGRTEGFEKAGTQEFFNSLSGSGYRPQDIALAYQVYG